jgi:multicomponent Na+:H+ antiporter subunit D
VAAHKTKVSELDGIGRTMPFTMAAFTLGALSMIGMPLLGGFISKWYLILGAVEAGQLPILIVLAGSTILNACYFLPIVHRAFFKTVNNEQRTPNYELRIHEAPAMMVVPLILTASGAVALFFEPSLFLDLSRVVVAGVTGGN